MMRLIFTNDIGVSKEHMDLMCADELTKQFDYEIWDLSPLFDQEGVINNVEGTIRVQSIIEFDAKLNDVVKKEKAIIISVMTESWWKQLKPVAKKYGVPIISTQKNNFTDILYRNIAFDLSVKLHWKARLIYIANSFYLSRWLLSLKYKRNVKYDYLISSYNIKPETVKHFIKGHNTKYDDYLKNVNSEDIIGKPYILFLDVGLYYHPFDYHTEDPNFDNEHYILQLNNYFDLLEKKYNKPVVIALHPVSQKILTTKNFNGRLVTCGKTTQLIHHADLVVSHFTTSLINVVLAKKPDIVISSYEIEHSMRKGITVLAKSFAKFCGFPIDSMDNPYLPEAVVNEEKYQKFIDKYIVNKDKLDMSNGQILTETINEIEGDKD